MIKVAVFGIVASLIAMKIKTIRPEIAILIAVISSILLAMYGLKQMEEILAVFETIRSYSKIPKSYFQILLKLIGISFMIFPPKKQNSMKTCLPMWKTP